MAGADRSGLVRPLRRAPQAEADPVLPFMLAEAALGQVEGEVAADVPGDPGGNGDQVTADGRGPGLRERQAGQGAGGAEQVVRHGRDRQPGRVHSEHPGWHMNQGAAGDVGEDLLHDGVVAVLPLGLDQLERGVGEDRVVAPDGEQLVLPGGPPALFRSRTRRTISRAVTAWPFFDANAVSEDFGDLGVGDPGIQPVVPDRARVADRGPRRPRRWRRSRRGCWRSSGR